MLALRSKSSSTTKSAAGTPADRAAPICSLFPEHQNHCCRPILAELSGSLPLHSLAGVGWWVSVLVLFIYPYIRHGSRLDGTCMSHSRHQPIGPIQSSHQAHPSRRDELSQRLNKRLAAVAEVCYIGRSNGKNLQNPLS